MKISRRGLLFGTASSIVYTSLLGTSSVKAKIIAGSANEEKKLLVKMIRILYPHDRFPDAPYERTADDVINKGNSSPAKTIMMTNGLNELKLNGFNTLNFQAATEYLKSIEKTAFFAHVRGTSTVTLYNDKQVWELLGYEGYSYDKGGYINRGFNDLNWLPSPRITEHPDLDKFLKS